MTKSKQIIIGAGLGGLTAGAKLSKKGKKVLLIEQHSVPGGCATTYKRKDNKIEVLMQLISVNGEKVLIVKIVSVLLWPVKTPPE